MTKPLVSVIITVYNGERYLAEAIESVLAQTQKPNEIIVVDGESQDNTEKIARSYRQVHFIRESVRGLANARNMGINVCQGELIAFLDHDDRWTPNKLKVQIDYLINNPKIQYVNALVKIFLEPGCTLRLGYTRKSLNRAMIGRTPGTLIARKSLFDRIGGFSADFVIGCDVEWFTRAKDNNIPMTVIPEVLLYKRLHNTNLSGNVQVNRQELFTIVKQSIMHHRKVT
ncbi:MAG TPA: glycosyltransferase [bacterium]|nr:glycosyltransferase [bacterium]